MSETKIEFEKLTPARLMTGEDAEETAALQAMYQEAERYLAAFKWSGTVRAGCCGIGIGDIVAVFLFEIEPRSNDVDRFLWVVVGDIPPAYLVVDEAPNAACALKVYLDEMMLWVEAVESGRPVDELIPVNAPPTKGNAKSLRKRLEFLKRDVLSEYLEDLESREG